MMESVGDLQRLGFELRQASNRAIYLLPPLCRISEGPFLLGSDPATDARAADEEQPQQTLWLPPYLLGTYPVTVAEYAYALEADAPGIRVPLSWTVQALHPLWPVHGLTWYDALGYACWLTAVSGQDWRLPTEAEWEKAARGPDGRIYPWGNQWEDHHANVFLRDAGMGPESEPLDPGPTQVDAYPQGASSYGVMDLTGNIAEWTSTIYDFQRFQYPYQATDGREALEVAAEFRVLRGGSWMDKPSRTRAASRGFFLPEDSGDWPYGLRLVRTGAF